MIDYSKSYAMEYEHLIRRAFECSRREKNGADADIFRDLTHARNLYQLEKENIENNQPRIWNKSLDELSYDLHRNCLKVSRHIKEAINHVLKEYKYNLENDKVHKLEEQLQILMQPTFEKIVDAIFISEQIMIDDLKLYAK